MTKLKANFIHTCTFTHTFLSKLSTHSYPGTRSSAKFSKGHGPSCSPVIRLGGMELIGLCHGFLSPRRTGWRGRRMSVSQQHSIHALRKWHNSYNNENLYAHVFVISTILQNNRDQKKKGIQYFKQWQPIGQTLQSRFKSSGGFCKSIEVQKHWKEGLSRTRADRGQTDLKIKTRLLGKYFWCLHTVSST